MKLILGTIALAFGLLYCLLMAGVGIQGLEEHQIIHEHVGPLGWVIYIVATVAGLICFVFSIMIYSLLMEEEILWLWDNPRCAHYRAITFQRLKALW